MIGCGGVGVIINTHFQIPTKASLILWYFFHLVRRNWLTSPTWHRIFLIAESIVCRLSMAFSWAFLTVFDYQIEGDNYCKQNFSTIQNDTSYVFSLLLFCKAIVCKQSLYSEMSLWVSQLSKRCSLLLLDVALQKFLFVPAIEMVNKNKTAHKTTRYCVVPHGRSEDLDLPVCMVDTVCYTRVWLLQNCAVSVLSPVVATSLPLWWPPATCRYSIWDMAGGMNNWSSNNYLVWIISK